MFGIHPTVFEDEQKKPIPWAFKRKLSMNTHTY